MSDIHVEPPEEEQPATVAFGPTSTLAARLRALRDRPPPGLVAAVSALIAGAAVAVYMDRPVEVVEAPSSLSQPIVEPQSWLNVQVDDVFEPATSGETQERMLAQHPPDATVALPLYRYEQHLLGLPPGTYHVQASCSTVDPVWFMIWITEPATYEPVPESSVDGDQDLVCDGDLYTVSARMTVTGYQAVAVSYSSAFDEEGEEVPPDMVVVASFTPVS